MPEFRRRYACLAFDNFRSGRPSRNQGLRLSYFIVGQQIKKPTELPQTSFQSLAPLSVLEPIVFKHLIENSEYLLGNNSDQIQVFSVQQAWCLTEICHYVIYPLVDPPRMVSKGLLMPVFGCFENRNWLTRLCRLRAEAV